MLESLTANVIMFVMDIHMYAVLSSAEKCMPYGELVDTTECITLHPKCRTIQYVRSVSLSKLVITEFNCIIL